MISQNRSIPVAIGIQYLQSNVSGRLPSALYYNSTAGSSRGYGAVEILGNSVGLNQSPVGFYPEAAGTISRFNMHIVQPMLDGMTPVTGQTVNFGERTFSINVAYEINIGVARYESGYASKVLSTNIARFTFDPITNATFELLAAAPVPVNSAFQFEVK